MPWGEPLEEPQKRGWGESISASQQKGWGEPIIEPIDEATQERRHKPTTGELVKGAWAKAMPFGLPISETIGHLVTAPVGFAGGLVGFGAKLLADLIPG